MTYPQFQTADLPAVRITIVQGPFLPVPPLMGGAVEKVWFNLGKEFAGRGHEVVHLSRAFKELPSREVIEGVRHERISGFSSPATFARRSVLDLWYGLRILPRLPAADVLVTNTLCLPALVRRRSRGRIYVHVARYPKGQMWLYRGAILQTVSEAIRQAILAEQPSAGSRIRVIPYPLSERYLRPELGSAEKIILYTGRVHPEKGVHLLIDAFRQLRTEDRAPWLLRIVGPAEVAYGGGGEGYLNELKEIAAPVADRVEFVGRVFDETRLIEYYRNASIFAYPSVAERGETFGLAVLEAMAAGCAPVVSNLACFQDFVRNEVNGLIFDHRTPNPAAELSRTLNTLMGDIETIERIRLAAWLTARDYTLPKIAHQFLADFAELSGKSLQVG